VPRQDELRAELDRGVVRKRAGVDAAADPVARLEDRDLDAGRGERVGRREPREAGPDDDDGSRSRGQRGSGG
jgi:hypothetical protein